VLRRVILIKGNSQIESGYKIFQSVTEIMLDKAKVPGWTKAKVIELSGNSRKDKKIIEREIKDKKIDLIHFTNQDDAGLVPKKSGIPIAISVHNLFDFNPRTLDAGDMPIPLGRRSSNSKHIKFMEEIRMGFNRSDLLICSTKMTLGMASESFPNSTNSLVRIPIDSNYWNPDNNKSDEEFSENFDISEKLLLVSVGDSSKMFRQDFIDSVVNSLPSEIKDEIFLLKIGIQKLTKNQILAAFCNAEAMLYPGLTIGFQNPSLEAMAVGCKVIASSLPTHDEIIPDNCLLPPSDIDAWRDEIMNLYDDWVKSGKVTMFRDEELITNSKKYNYDSQGIKLAHAYNNIIK